MEMREKLIELLDESEDFSYVADRADHLISNGVTIPVKCGECKFSKEAEWYRAKLRCTHPSCMGSQVPYEVPPSHFCSYGERRTK